MFLSGEFVVKPNQRGKWDKIVEEESDNLYMQYIRTLDSDGKNSYLALTYLEQSANLNNIRACMRLGYEYSKSDGYLPKDQATAFKWYRRAHELGSADGTYAIAFRYYVGQGIPKDFVKAFALASQAANADNVDAMGLLAELYYYGTGTVKDLLLAYAWYSIAASKGDADAGKMLELLEKELPRVQVEEAQKKSAELIANVKIVKQQ